MIINCFRCAKPLDTPDSTNADYVIAPDMVVRETRESLLALTHNQKTLAKKAAGQSVDESEYDVVEIPCVEAAKSLGADLVKVVVEMREKDIQKTGIICPDCYRPADFIIWGVHKAGNSR